jgi:itaconate CoA-transferase
MNDVWQHSQLLARGRWSKVETPAGPIAALLPPGAACAPMPRMDAIPALGQHTDMILAELGWSAADIAVLRSAGAI